MLIFLQQYEFDGIGEKKNQQYYQIWIVFVYVVSVEALELFDCGPQGWSSQPDRLIFYLFNVHDKYILFYIFV